MEFPPFPKGNWKQSASDICRKDGDPPLLICQLRKIDGSTEHQTIVWNEEDTLENIDGFFFRTHPFLLSTLNLHPIPARIFQTHRSMEYVKQNRRLRRAVQSWTKYSGSFTYTFHDDIQSRQFIVDHFEEDVVRAYDRCPLAVMKADLWRYAILYIYGGIYSDVDTNLRCSPHLFLVSDAALVVTMENPPSNNLFCQWTFAAPPGSFILKEILDLSISRILEIPEIKGEHIVHFLTGPGLFSDGIERALQKKGMGICPSHRYHYYPHYQNYGLHVFSPDRFHGPMIEHLFEGIHGWKRERDLIFK